MWVSVLQLPIRMAYYSKFSSPLLSQNRGSWLGFLPGHPGLPSLRGLRICARLSGKGGSLACTSASYCKRLYGRRTYSDYFPPIAVQWMVSRDWLTLTLALWLVLRSGKLRHCEVKLISTNTNASLQKFLLINPIPIHGTATFRLLVIAINLVFSYVNSMTRKPSLFRIFALCRRTWKIRSFGKNMYVFVPCPPSHFSVVS